MKRQGSKAMRCGARLGSYRSGDRSEYLATYALSRVAYVSSIPRQSDFGLIDCLCVLARSESKYIYPEAAFYVQVKSDRRAYTLSDVEFNWLTEHMEHPLFFCVVDKVQLRISLYSCIPLWHAVFGRWQERRTITIKFNGPPGEESNKQYKDRRRYTINLGHPVLEQSIDDIESKSGWKIAYAVLRDWISLDATNIARKRVRRTALRVPTKWQTNVPPLSDSGFEFSMYYFWALGGAAVIEADLAPILVALSVNYQADNKTTERTALCGFLDKIRKYLNPADLEVIGAEFDRDPA
jgi:hypothetical protein